MFATLNEFLQLGLPRVTYTRDSQLYTRQRHRALGISDLHGSRIDQEKTHWARIGGWIEHQPSCDIKHRQQALQQHGERFQRLRDTACQ